MLGNGFSKINDAGTSFIVAYGSMSYTVSMNFDWMKSKVMRVLLSVDLTLRM